MGELGFILAPLYNTCLEYYYTMLGKLRPTIQHDPALAKECNRFWTVPFPFTYEARAIRIGSTITRVHVEPVACDLITDVSLVFIDKLTK
jgi:hypothetical protein